MHRDRRSAAASLGFALALAAGCAESPPASPTPSEAGERVRAILADADPLARAAELGALLSQLPPDALPAVRDAFGDASVDRGDTEVVLLATWWARFDPEGAQQWTIRDWTASHLSVISAVYRTWAERDPLSAWAAAQRLLIPLQRELASDAVIIGWRDGASPSVEDHLAALPPGETVQRAAEALARRRVVDLGARRALEWVETLADPGFQQLMRARAAGAAAWVEPAVAASWVAPQIDSDDRTSGLARRVATRWVRSDPEAAMAWLATLPDGGDREDGVLEAYRDWLFTNAQHAVAWIERQPVEPWLEPAFSLYARGPLVQRDPEAALALAARFSDEDRRNTTSTYIARGWLERDWAAADAWLKQSQLPKDVVERSYMISNRPRSDRHGRAAADAMTGTGAQR